MVFNYAREFVLSRVASESEGEAFVLFTNAKMIATRVRYRYSYGAC